MSALGGDVERHVPIETDFDKGHREGVVDATLSAHALHLRTINGNIARANVVTQELTTTVRDGLAAVESAVRTLQEEARLAEERVNVAAATLARETERRREELAATAAQAALSENKNDRRWSRSQEMGGIALAFLALVATIVGLYIASGSGHSTPKPAVTVTVPAAVAPAVTPSR